MIAIYDDEKDEPEDDRLRYQVGRIEDEDGNVIGKIIRRFKGRQGKRSGSDSVEKGVEKGGKR